MSLLENHQLKTAASVQITVVSDWKDTAQGGHSGPRHTNKTKPFIVT